MSKATIKTNNDPSFFPIKVKMRLDYVESLASNTVNVLDAYAGEGKIWKAVKQSTSKKIKCLAIDREQYGKRIQLKGDNLKFLAGFDLSQFDIIDLDAYGSPVPQMEILFKRKYKGAVFCTFIQTMQGRMSNILLLRLGYSKAMIQKCPTLFSKNGKAKFLQWLGLNGVNKAKIFSENQKNYLFLKINS